MKSPAVATILSALALGGVAVLWFEVDDLKDMLQTRSTQAVRQVPPTPPADSAAAGPGYAGAGHGTTTARVGMDAEPPPGAAGRGAAGGETSALPGEESREPAGSLRMPEAALGLPFRGRMATSVDDLTRRLALTVAQKDRVSAAIERGRLRVEEIMKIPDETGRSPYERREEQRRKIKEAIQKQQDNPEAGAAGFLHLATDFFDYRKQQIPGRNATYGQEIDRIQKETRAEIASTLNADQKQAFEQTSIDPLVGGGGARSVSVFVAGDGEQDGAVLIETDFTATAGVGSAGEPAAPKQPAATPADDG